MASTTQKWFIGCGIGCGLMILIVAVIGGGLFFAVKDIVKEAESIDDNTEALVAEFGDAQDFVPSIDGAVSPDRMEAFLATRSASAPAREKMAGLLHTLDDDDDGQGDTGVLAKIKAGATFIPAMLGYINERNQHLMDSGMGLGEYTYIYSLAYFNYLEKDLTDGPSFQVTGDDADDDSDGSGFQWKVGSGSSGKKVDKSREKQIRRHLHRLQSSFLSNQLAATPEGEWRTVLMAEKEAMVSAPRRVLWEEGLPPAISASFAPYADRLNESYTAILNVVEMGMTTGN